MQNTKFNCHIYKEVNIRSNILLSFFNVITLLQASKQTN